MEPSAVSISNTASAAPKIKNKNRGKARIANLRAAQQLRKIDAQGLLNVDVSDNIAQNVDLHAATTAVTAGAIVVVDTEHVNTEEAEVMSNHNLPDDTEQSTSLQTNAEPHESVKPNKPAKLNLTSTVDALFFTSTYVKSVGMVATTPGTASSSVKKRRPHKKGKRGLNREYKNKPRKESDEIVETSANPGSAQPDRRGNSHVSATIKTVPGDRSTTILSEHMEADKSNLRLVNTLKPSRVLQMAPVVLPRRLEFPTKSTKKVIRSSHQTPEQTLKPAKDFIKDIPKMTEDLKRVIEKQEQHAVEAATSKPSAKKAEIKNNPTNFMVLETPYTEPVVSQSLPATPADAITFEEWKKLPPNKRYSPLTHKEKLAISTMEMIPQTYIESADHQTANQAAELVSPRKLPLIDRMAFTFARVMAFARNEADNGHFDWSTQDAAKSSSDFNSNDIMSRAQVEAFVTGMQEVKDPDRGGLVVMRRYWRIISGLEEGDGVGGVIAACSREERYLGRPSFKLKAREGGVDAVLVCEVEVDREGVMVGREWNEVE